jgi:hypothetical protein
MKTIPSSLATLMLSVLAACGGGGSDSVDSVDTTLQSSISGTVTKGPVGNATVTAYGIGNGQMGPQIGTATTDANGNFTMTVVGHTGPAMLQVSGGRYTDEATGTSMAMGAGDVMTAAMPNIAAGTTYTGVQVTPVTAMAQAMANRMAGGMTDANIAAANAAMGRYFAVADILHDMPMNPLVAGSGAAASQDGRNYGMTLAAMSKYAQSQGMSSSSAMMTLLMNDAADGVMDGRNGAGQISMSMGGMMGGGMMSPAAGTSGLSGAMTGFMNSSMNASGMTSADMNALIQKLANSNGQL